jgi:colanic acid/amylovoran biosynthesis glycosyltransferase
MIPDTPGILMVALCGAEPRPNSIVIDRKFHEGMSGFAKRLKRPFVCLVPRYTRAEISSAMDMIEVPLDELSYRVSFLESSPLSVQGLRTIERSLDQVALVYLGALDNLGLVIASLCRKRDIPYIVLSEYTARTELEIMRAMTPALLRRIWREVRMRLGNYRRRQAVAGAEEVHANGYPTYRELASINPRRILFFDTRARAEDIIPEHELHQRLAARAHRRPRLIFSGRYHPMKGALDVIKVGIELERLGLDFQLDLYGTGPLKREMAALVSGSKAAHKITINDSVPYRPELQRITKQADLFICCHVQGDPSCTYLETFACGVPIVGYANEMWSPLWEESRAGLVIAKGDYRALAKAAAQLLQNADLMEELSLRARMFAASNTMEVAWDLRVSHLAGLVPDAFPWNPEEGRSTGPNLEHLLEDRWR